MAGSVAATALAVVAALAMSCGGDAPPTPSPTFTATAAPPTATVTTPATAPPTATVTTPAPPTATATATATPVPTATATAPAPTATGTATAPPSPSPAPTTLAVFSTLVSEAYREEGWEWARRVYVIDTGTGTYWRVFDYLYEGTTRLLTANGSIVFADGERVRRFALDGRDETTLYEGEAIRELSVSPDGAKVAFTDADGILVLDVASGEQVLRARHDAELAALLPDASDTSFSLERWNDVGNAIAITASDGGTRNRTGILALDGELQVLPRNRGNLSPDFRHAIRNRLTDTTGYGVVSGFEVIELESGRAAHTVIADADTFVIPWPGWWLGPDRFSWFEMSRKIGDSPCRYDLTARPREAGNVTAAHTCIGPIGIAYNDIAAWEEGFDGESAIVGPRILDVASGAIRMPAQDEWRRMRADAPRLSTRGFCGFRQGGATCSLLYQGRPIWTGPDLEAIGLIEPDEPFAPRGVEVRAVPRPSAPQPPPARAEMAGPLLVWSEAGGYEAETGDDGAERFHALRRVMVHDAGTGRSWRAFDYRYPPPSYAYIHPTVQVQAARAGFTVWVEDGWNAGAVRFISLEGRETTLAQGGGARGVLLAPSGERAIVRTGAEDMEGALLIFDLPSGRLHRRIDLSVLRARSLFPDEWRGEGEFRLDLVPARWSEDETRISVVAIRYPDWDLSGLASYNSLQYSGDYLTGVLSLDGSFRLLPPDVIERALSPDFRYIARGRNPAGEFVSRWESWEGLAIIDMATGRVVRSVPVGERTGMALRDDDWGWTADGRFAWGPGISAPPETRWAPPRPPRPPGDEDDPHPVELLDVRTGGIERVAPDEYFTDERASASCPEDDPIGRCSVLLDGEVVGRGQWAQVIGVVALD